MAVAVVELDLEGEGLLVKLPGFFPAPLLLLEAAQLVIGFGLAVAVVELDLEGEGLLVKLLGFFPAPLLLRDAAKLVENTSFAPADEVAWHFSFVDKVQGPLVSRPRLPHSDEAADSALQ